MNKALDQLLTEGVEDPGLDDMPPLQAEEPAKRPPDQGGQRQNSKYCFPFYMDFLQCIKLKTQTIISGANMCRGVH